VQPRWATGRQRLELLGLGVVMYAVFYPVLKALGSWGPQWDAWILAGSVLATYGMARGWVEFWLVWIAVDVVGVPLLLKAKFYPSATMYIVYGVFCVIGFAAWLRVERAQTSVEIPELEEAVS
jgi:nicotinamide mononucleotide transporter